MSWNKRIPMLSNDFNPANSGSQLSPEDIRLIILIDGATNLDGIAVLAGVETENLYEPFERFAEMGAITWKNVSLEDSRKKYSHEDRTTSSLGEPPSIVGSSRLERSPKPRPKPAPPQRPAPRSPSGMAPPPPTPPPASARQAPMSPSEMPPPPPTPAPAGMAPQAAPRSPSDMPPPPPTPVPGSVDPGSLNASPSMTPPPPSAFTPPPPTEAPARKAKPSFSTWGSEQFETKQDEPFKQSEPAEATLEPTFSDPPLSQNIGEGSTTGQGEHTLDPDHQDVNDQEGESTMDEQPYVVSPSKSALPPMPLTSWEKEKIMREKGELPPESPSTSSSSSSSTSRSTRSTSPKSIPSMPITSWEAQQGRLPSPSEEGMSASEAELASIVPSTEEAPAASQKLEPSMDSMSTDAAEEEWDSADDWWALGPEDVGLKHSDYTELIARRERRLQNKGLGEGDAEHDDGFTPLWREDLFGHLPMFKNT